MARATDRMLDFRTVNTLWAAVLVETLVRLGLTTAVVCPGSRSAPLAIACAQHPQLQAIPVLDERSAAFFALGLARRTHRPVVLVCTSGTAGANFFPAVIEAHESQVPLLILTADRPPELRQCHAGQAIDQVKLYGQYPNWQHELALPERSVELFAYLRQTLVYAWTAAQRPVPGPVHLNLPFREPLAPTWDQETLAWSEQIDWEAFLAAVQPQSLTPISVGLGAAQLPLSQWQQCDRGLIIAGAAQPIDPIAYCRAVAQIAQFLGWPVLADSLSPLRNFAALNPYLISSYDLILRQPQVAQELVPTQVIRLGELPTSKTLRIWLASLNASHWIVDPAVRNFDPLHGQTTHLYLSVAQLAEVCLSGPKPTGPNPYTQQWLTQEQQIWPWLQARMQSEPALVEGKIAWTLSQHLPSETRLFVANSTPIRDLEWFWQPGNRQIQTYFNRGANGIDGTLSTALGVAYSQPYSVLLTGDLALLHDTNGFLLSNRLVGHLTIILINNNGGGIFELLPIARADVPFEEFFATPQRVEFATLCAAYGIAYTQIQSWDHLIQQLQHPPPQGLRLLEVRCDRKADAQWRQALFQKLSQPEGQTPSAQG